MEFVPHCLANFTQHNALQSHPCICTGCKIQCVLIRQIFNVLSMMQEVKPQQKVRLNKLCLAQIQHSRDRTAGAPQALKVCWTWASWRVLTGLRDGEIELCHPAGLGVPSPNGCLGFELLQQMNLLNHQELKISLKSESDNSSLGWSYSCMHSSKCVWHSFSKVLLLSGMSSHQY